MAAYLPMVCLLALGVLFAAGSFLASRLLAPSRRTAAKEGPYESGIVPSSDPAQRFPVRFYLVAMIFVIFDIEIIFTYPWAVIYSRDLGKFGLIEFIVFAVVVLISFLYLVSNGALDWGPTRAPVAPAAEERTTRTTVQRVRKVRREEAAGPGPELVDSATTRG
jgi:NADH-quinone oxidoreductase subunit A